MPNRILKESICESDGLSQCSFFAKDLYTRLITYADDYGRFNADTQIMAARLYPRELDCVTQEDITEALIELAGVEKIAFYTSKARKTIYGCFPNWNEHQRVRDSKQKCPDPDDTDVNDWYLQRFIPMDMKIEIVELSGFKCQICGKFITSDKDAKRLAKHGCGMYHIDHIVPVAQGGRATLENLRLTCPSCNLKRRKKYSFKEIVQFSLGDTVSPQVAATRRDSPQVAASCGNSPPESNPNPIQSESISESQSESESNAGAFAVFWDAYPRKVGKVAAKKAFAKVDVPLSTLLEAIERQKQSGQWTKDGGQYIPNPATWLNQGRWEDELPGGKTAGGGKKSWAELAREMDEEEGV